MKSKAFQNRLDGEPTAGCYQRGKVAEAKAASRSSQTLRVFRFLQKYGKFPSNGFGRCVHAARQRRTLLGRGVV